jgi:ubiquitin C-terminal hydrolase
MKYRIKYNLKGGSSEYNGNIIWNEKNEIVLNKYIYKYGKKKEITYDKFSYCPITFDPFKCLQVEVEEIQEKDINVWSHEEVNFDWLNFGRNGMTNCGGSCYFNAYMQCILFTYPLIYNIKLVIQSNYPEKNEFETLVSDKFSVNDNIIYMEQYKPSFSDFKNLGPNVLMHINTEHQDTTEYLQKFFNSKFTDKYTIIFRGFDITDLILTKINIHDAISNALQYYGFDYYNRGSNKLYYIKDGIQIPLSPFTNINNNEIKIIINNADNIDIEADINNIYTIGDDQASIKNNLFDYYFSFFIVNITHTYDKGTRILKKCNLKSEVIKFFTMQITDRNKVIKYRSLEKCFNEFFNSEDIKDSDNTKTYKILNLPKILVISLNRFSYKEKEKISGNTIQFHSEKLKHKVEIPYQLNSEFFEKYMFKKKDPFKNKFYNNKIYTYDLYSFAYHDGEQLSGGHYISYIKKPRFSKINYNSTFLPGWYCANDSNFDMISPYDEDFVDHLNHGYLYFYKARDYDNNDYFHHHIGNEDIKFRY